MEVKGAGQLEDGLGDAVLALLQGTLDRATAPGPARWGAAVGGQRRRSLCAWGLRLQRLWCTAC